MKRNKILMLAMLLLGSWQAMAQKANAVFFTSEGERFTVIMNGQKYNESPQTNVKATDLNPTAYQVKILFEDQALGTIDQKVYLEPGKESTYTIKKKTKTETGKTLNKLGKTVGRDLGISDPNNQKPMEEEFYVIRLLSLEPVAGLYNRPGQPQTVTTIAPAGGTVTTTQHTTTTVNGQPVTGESVTMGVSINTPEGNMNMSVNGGSTYHTTGAVTTTTTTSHSNQGTYVLPGYSGPYGCPYPMSDSEFQRAKSSISGKSFEESKLQIAKQITKSNCLLASQVREIMSLMTFEESKLDFAKYAYGFTLDLKNYYKVNDAFQFESSISELDNYIGASR